MTGESTSLERQGEGLARAPFRARGRAGRAHLPPEPLDAPVRVQVRFRARGPGGQVCLPLEPLDAPVRVWVPFRAREPGGRVCLLPEGPDAIGDSGILTHRAG